MTETRKAFHEELAEVSESVVRLGALAGEAINAGTDCLLGSDLAAAELVIAADAVTDELARSIEAHSFLLLARQQPMAVDLRTLVTVLRIAHELERIGDLMVNVAKASRRLYPYQMEPRIRGLLHRMREQALAQLKLAIDAFAERDAVRAAALSDMDDVMDELQKELFRVLFELPAREEGVVQRAVQIALVGRYFERIADHAVNTGERVAYIVTGEFLDEPHHRERPNPSPPEPRTTGAG
jgi:phosphate transport system protein